MNLLVINFQMDPASTILAWQVKVACELARHCAKVIVLTNRAADFETPPNLEVRVFPQACVRAPLRLIGGRWLVNPFVWALCRRNAVDSCFIHMNMEWAYRLYPTFWLLGIPSLLWYAHGVVTRRLRLAHRCVSRVVTSTSEGFRIPSAKVAVIGQGVDTELFALRPAGAPQNDIITVGRISPRKRLDLEIEALAALRSKVSTPFHLKLIGPTLNARDEEYARHLRALAAGLGLSERVTLMGGLPIGEIPRHYASAFVHLNVSKTGSMDKAVLEALASGCPVLTSNEAFRGLLGDHRQYVLQDEAAESIAERLLAIHEARDRVDRVALRALVVGRHDLRSYALRILDQLRDLDNRA